MNRRLWSSVIAAALVLGALSGCSTDIETSVPPINIENPALASVTHSSTNSDIISSQPSSSSSTSSSTSSTTSTSSSTSTSTSTKSADEKVDEKLMETLDGYEDFFKEYTLYIKGRNEKDSAKIQEYAKKSEEISELLENYDASGLNAKEQIYLADVKYRISKLLDSVKDKLPKWNEESGEYEMSTSSTTSRPVATSPYSTSKKPESSSSSAAPDSSVSSSSPEETVSSGGGDTGTSVGSTVITDYSLPEIVDVSDPDTSSLLTDYTRKWAYNHISDAQKILYARLFDSAQNNSGDINVSDLGLKEADILPAYWAFDYDNANFLALGSGYSYNYDTSTGNVVSVSIDYGRSSGNVPASQFESTAQSIIAEAGQMGSDYERLKYIHDWLVNNTDYVNNGTASRNEADGPLVYGQAVCEGYSKAFMYLAQSMGYECVCVGGYAQGPHMWNMVKVGGEWYHVDVTWDDPLSSGGPILRHDYFLVSDSTIRSDHSLDNYFDVPSAPYDYQQ